MQTDEQKEAFVKKYIPFFRKLFKEAEPNEWRNIADKACEGIILQLMSCPLDLFVEDLIYNNYPELRPVQFLSLLDQEGLSLQAGAPKVARTFPKDITRANRIMNICTSLHFRQLYHVDMTDRYKVTRADMKVAEDLYNKYLAYTHGLQPGEEYGLVEYFGETFNAEDYYKIIDEKDTPAFTQYMKLKEKTK